MSFGFCSSSTSWHAGTSVGYGLCVITAHGLGRISVTSCSSTEEIKVSQLPNIKRLMCANSRSLAIPVGVSIHCASLLGNSLGALCCNCSSKVVELSSPKHGCGWNGAVGFKGRKWSPSQMCLRTAVARDASAELLMLGTSLVVVRAQLKKGRDIPYGGKRNILIALKLTDCENRIHPYPVVLYRHITWPCTGHVLVVAFLLITQTGNRRKCKRNQNKGVYMALRGTQKFRAR
ncbi:hypothetical protein BGX38DRAFT_475481 [Terfezia claveryi]|nr:hypothetical protein BGX38DRAFT_475481 [Terfezia claveryi]